MSYAERELLVSRITSGKLRCRITVGGQSLLFILHPPTRDNKYIANELYQSVLEEAEFYEVLSEQEMMAWMYRYELWSDELQNKMTGIEEDIDEIKVKLFELTFNSQQRYQVRTKLEEAKEQLKDLYGQKHSYDFVTTVGVASTAKVRFLLGTCLRYPNGEPYWTNNDEGWNASDIVLDRVLEFYSRNRLDDGQIRDVVKNEPWASMWAPCKTAYDMFGIPSIDLTTEQHMAINWSIMYNNIRESPDCPNDEIVKDDDMLDGWLILQRRKRQADIKRRQVDEKLGKKGKDAHEVYLPADTRKDAREIDDLNTPEAKYIKSQRMAYLKEKGTVNELDMPDTKQRLAAAINQHFKNAVKRR